MKKTLYNGRLHIHMLSVLMFLWFGLSAFAQCPEEPPMQHYAGTGTVVCPCFIAGEEAGAVFSAPSEHYPLEILRIGIGWGSQYGGAFAQIEQAIKIYGSGLPNPGSPLFELEGPQLTDGVINEFDLEPLPGEIAIDSGAFTVTIEFLNDNAGDPFSPSVVHDGNGCQSNKNVVFAIPGGWYNACALGITGDWIFYVVYRPCVSATGIDEEQYTESNVPVFFGPPLPNPFETNTRMEFVLSEPGRVTISAYDVGGRRVADIADAYYPAGRHAAEWNLEDEGSTTTPSGMYFLHCTAHGFRTTKKVMVLR